MSLVLNTRKVNGHIVVEASGRLEYGDASLELRELAQKLTSDGGRFFVLDLSGVTHIDSLGLGVLLSIYATIRNQGGDLKLLNVSARVRELLKVTKLNQVFDIFEDETAAIAGKASGAPSA
ncbi:MAG TPA: STAS domain-containing protein [Terriglobia bacterium]|nr:STAS domain-containing protein [Terriglobia bacterium]